MKRSLPALVSALLAMSLVTVVPVVTVPSAAVAAEAPDTDGDGLPDWYERNVTSTDPLVADTDGDGVPDGREDPDDDKVVNTWERRLALDPLKADTDGDGTSDGGEDPDGDRLKNRFEIRISHTDPRTNDTDRDGLVDSVEDPDDDELSNAGEELFGTAPGKADTDGDGIDDWHEDADHDGQPDGLTQDQRRVPGGLQPALTRPAAAVVSRSGCHQGTSGTVVLVCDRHTGDGKLVVMIGDSHAWQWRDAMDRVARSRNWDLLFITKSACPVADVPLAHGYRSCPTWRDAALAEIGSLRPGLVIVTQLDGYRVAGARAGADNARLWRQGLTRSLRQLDRVARDVILLGDISRFGSDPVGCLQRHRSDLSKCSIRKADAANPHRFATDRAAARAAGVAYRDTWQLTCPYDPCPVVIDKVLVARDSTHITVTYARLIWRGLARRLPR